MFNWPGGHGEFLTLVVHLLSIFVCELKSNEQKLNEPHLPDERQSYILSLTAQDAFLGDGMHVHML